MTTITDINDSRIQHYRTLQGTPDLHTRDRVFIAEGEKTVRALLRSPLELLSVFALPTYYERLAPLLAGRDLPEDMLFTADRELMNDIVGFRLHQGVMAMARQPGEPELRDLQPQVVVLDGVVDSENVGAVVRNCAAFGARSLIVGGTGSSPYLRRAVRASMGAVCFMDVYFSEDLPYTLGELRDQYGFSIISVEQSPSALSLGAFAFPERCAVVFGSEGAGISERVLSTSDHVVSIPHSSDVDSLNIASAAAVVLYTLHNSFSRAGS